MTAFAARVLRSVRERALLQPGARIGVAVSGGPDSTALFLVLLELSKSLGVTIDCVVHVNHGLRGGGAEADAAWVEALAARHGVPCVTCAVATRAFASRHGVSLEAAGHRLRRRVFGHVRGTRRLDAIATGHTLDDQAETVLLRLVRGASARGLRGISPRRPGLIRPLLTVPRRDIDRYIASRGVEPRVDPSNVDDSIPRNRVRHEVLPLLERRFSPRVREAIGRAAAALAEDDDALVAEAASGLAQLEYAGASVSLPARALLSMAGAPRLRLVRACLERCGCRLSSRHLSASVAACVRVAMSGGGETVGPLRVSKEKERLVLERVAVDRVDPPRTAPSPEMRLLVAGGAVDTGAWVVSVAPAASDELPRHATDVFVDADAVVLPLGVRLRRPGDRVRPLGAPGRRKIQDVLVDRKVARAERDAVPVVVDAAGRIVWLAGHVLAHEVRVTVATRHVLHLSLRPAGGAV